MSVVALEQPADLAAVVAVTRADGTYDIEVRPGEAGARAECEALGVSVALPPGAAAEVAASLLRAADALSRGGWATRHLRPMGAWDLPVDDAGIQRIELDAVRDDREGVRGVLISLDGLSLEGYLDEHAARDLAEALLRAV